MDLQLLEAAPRPDQFFKFCGCCGAAIHAGIWARMRLARNRSAPQGRNRCDDIMLEWRHCQCGSTLAVELESYDSRLQRARDALAHAEARVGLRRAA